MGLAEDAKARGIPQGPASSPVRFTRFSPFEVPWLALPVFVAGPEGALVQATGLDAFGQWWCFTRGVSPNFYKCAEPGSDTRDWFERAADTFVSIAVPLIAAAVAAAAPGIGTVAGAAILAWRNLAQGGSISDAVLAATRAKFATSSPSALSAFDQGLDAVRSGLTADQIHALGGKIASGLLSGDAQVAFAKAVNLVRAQQTQRLTVGALGASLLDPDEINRLQLALKWGAPLADVAWGLRGPAGQRALLAASTNAAQLVASSGNDPAALAKVATSPTLLKKLAAAPAGGGGNGGPTGPGLGTFAVGGALLYVGYRLVRTWARSARHA